MEACLAAGTIVSGPRHSFVLEKVLGKGGFGITYRGQEIASKRKVAIKEYFPISGSVPKREKEFFK